MKVRHHDGSMVLLNDETKWIAIRKILNPYSSDERETYEQFELGSNGTVEVRLPTSVKDNSFHLDVSNPHCHIRFLIRRRTEYVIR